MPNGLPLADFAIKHDINRAPAPANRPDGPSHTPRKRKGTLLIVDDEEGARQALRVIFKDDYHILMAEDGASAVRLAQDNKVDAAVLDIRMAGMSGIQQVEEPLKFVDSDIEVVMMTAFETTDTMRQALRLRACDYINKPFDVSTMRAAVENAMHRHTLEGDINEPKSFSNCSQPAEPEDRGADGPDAWRNLRRHSIHDINGPLTVISGFVQLMNQRIGWLSGWRSKTLNSSRTALRPSPDR